MRDNWLSWRVILRAQRSFWLVRTFKDLVDIQIYRSARIFAFRKIFQILILLKMSRYYIGSRSDTAVVKRSEHEPTIFFGWNYFR